MRRKKGESAKIENLRSCCTHGKVILLYVYTLYLVYLFYPPDTDVNVFCRRDAVQTSFCYSSSPQQPLQPSSPVNTVAPTSAQ